jgi:hypothetical protein
MFGKKVQKGLDITRESWQVLRQDTELLLFPVFSALAGLTILATITSAGLLIPGLGQWLVKMLQERKAETLGEQALGIVCLFVVYFVQWFVVVFFNTALVGCALMRFSGGDPTVKDGFRIAFQRLPQIVAWTLFVSAVGTLLSAIEQKLGWLGKLIIRFIGLTWAIATYFVVPVLAAEGTGPLTAVRRSVELLKKSWGEGLTGNFTIQVVSWFVALPAIFLAVGGFVLAALLESVVLAVLTGALAIFGLIVLAIVSSALRQIFLAGLYRFATTGQVPHGFSEDSMRRALRPKTA